MHQKENFQPAVYLSGTESSSMRAWIFDFGYGTDDHSYYKDNKAYTLPVNINTFKKLKTQFSLFKGFSASDLKSPFDFWKNFIDDEFADFKINQNTENLHFHCCIIPENEDLSENDFLFPRSRQYIRKLIQVFRRDKEKKKIASRHRFEKT